MKVIQIAKMFPPPFGGVETVVASLVQGFAPNPQVDLEVFAARMDGKFGVRSRQFSGTPIREVTSLGILARTPIAPSLLPRAIAAGGDLLHYHFPYPWVEAMQATLGLRKPYIVSYHGDIGRFPLLYAAYRPFMNKFLRDAAAIVVATTNHISSSSVLVGPLVDKCHIIPFGMDLAPYLSTPALEEEGKRIRASLGLKGPVLLFVGRLVNYKGLPTLLKAMRQIDATLLVIGEGPLREELEAESTELGVQDKVRWLGAIPFQDLPAHYHASDLFVLPSDRPEEAFALVQVEAHAAGRPVVCCALPTGVTKVNEHGTTGLVVPLQDPPAMAEAINGLLRDDEWRLRLGRQARERAIREFSLDSMCGRYQALYAKVLGGHA